MEIIDLQNINFSYPEKESSDKFSLKDIELKIFAADFISILGPNGCGKSTLLKIIANIIKPDSGTSKLYGNDYNKIKRKDFAKKIAFVPQNSSTNFPYSLYEIVMMGRSPHLNILGIEASIDHDFVMQTLDLLEISHLKNKGINEVSGGEAQRAFIARAIVQDTEILLLDEPNSHLDIKHQLSIYNLLKNLNASKKLTIITISHDLNLSNYFSNRAILMDKGRILFDSIPEEILIEKNINQIFGINAKIIKNEMDSSQFISLI